MQCPNCQNALVEIPTLEGPQLDVCPARHGLWLDRGEVTLLVENYRAFEQTPSECVTAAGGAPPACPKCGGLLDQELVLTTALFACRACHGWWLPKGSLTQLNATARGGAARTRLDEADYYRRAQKRESQPQARAQGTLQSRHRPRAHRLWFWTLFLSVALLLAGLILVAGVRKIVARGAWSTPPTMTWMFLSLGTLAGMGLLTHGLVLNSRKRLIESIPTSAVRSLAIGLVEVTGRAQPEGPPLRAPFSALPCVFYAYVVEERRQSGKETRWETIAKGTSQEPFYVQDETGRVLVVPLDARLILPDNRTTRSNCFGAIPQETMLGLSKLGIAADGWFGEKTIRCSETFILPDERVYVMGTAHERGCAGDSPENSARLYIGSSRDDDFFISDRSEKELLFSLRWQVWASIAGGAALALLCLLIMFKP